MGPSDATSSPKICTRISNGMRSPQPESGPCSGVGAGLGLATARVPESCGRGARRGARRCARTGPGSGNTSSMLSDCSRWYPEPLGASRSHHQSSAERADWARAPAGGVPRARRRARRTAPGAIISAHRAAPRSGRGGPVAGHFRDLRRRRARALGGPLGAGALHRRPAPGGPCLWIAPALGRAASSGPGWRPHHAAGRASPLGRGARRLRPPGCRDRPGGRGAVSGPPAPTPTPGPGPRRPHPLELEPEPAGPAGLTLKLGLPGGCRDRVRYPTRALSRLPPQGPKHRGPCSTRSRLVGGVPLGVSAARGPRGWTG